MGGMQDKKIAGRNLGPYLVRQPVRLPQTAQITVRSQRKMTLNGQRPETTSPTWQSKTQASILSNLAEKLPKNPAWSLSMYVLSSSPSLFVVRKL